MAMEIAFTPLPITGLIGCVVPIVPGTEGNIDAPVEQRTELCAIDANWVVGMVPTCDCHVREMIKRLREQPDPVDWTWEGLIEEAGRDPQKASLPWADRLRHPQAQVRDQKMDFEHMAGLARREADSAE